MVPSVLRTGLPLALYGTLHRLVRTGRGLAAWLRQMMLPVPLMFVLMVAASAIAISAFASVYEANRNQVAARDQAQNLARQLALTADDRLASGSIDLLQRDLAAAASNPRVIEVAVLDSGGHLLARAIRPNSKPAGSILIAASATGAGSVRVTEQAPDSEALSGFAVALVALNALVLALAVVVATRLARRAYRPVRRFTEVVSNLTADRFNLDSPKLGDRLLQPALDHLWTMGRSVTARERELAAQNTLWQRRYGQARTLIDLMAEFNQVMVLRAVLERLSLGLSRFFAGDAVAIWIFAAPRGDLGLAAEVAGTFPRRLSGSDQWVRQVLTAGAPPPVRCPWIQEAFPSMAAPLLDAQGRTIGLVMLTSSRRTEYSLEERAFLRTVIAHAAMAIQNAAVYEHTDALSRTDALTGLHNRREFDRVLGQELARARQTAQPLALLMVDIDNFKRINDERGHQAGDVALQQLARLIQQVPARANDAAFRFGGEEFAIVLTQTDKASALAKAETLRRVTEESAFLDTGSQLTVSVGVANFPDDGMELAQLVTCADRALYQAKNAGRNRVQAA